MGDKPGGAKKLDLTPLFLLFLLCIIIGLGTVQLPEPVKDEGKKASAEGGQTTIFRGGGCEPGGGSGCGGVQSEPKAVYAQIDTTVQYTLFKSHASKRKKRLIGKRGGCGPRRSIISSWRIEALGTSASDDMKPNNARNAGRNNSSVTGCPKPLFFHPEHRVPAAKAVMVAARNVKSAFR